MRRVMPNSGGLPCVHSGSGTSLHAGFLWKCTSLCSTLAASLMSRASLADSTYRPDREREPGNATLTEGMTAGVAMVDQLINQLRILPKKEPPSPNNVAGWRLWQEEWPLAVVGVAAATEAATVALAVAPVTVFGFARTDARAGAVGPAIARNFWVEEARSFFLAAGGSFETSQAERAWEEVAVCLGHL